MSLLSEPAWDDEAQAWRVWEQDGYVMWVKPMIVNHRVIIGQEGDSGYDVGWCYSDAFAALVAVSAFDPATMAEPAGYNKRATRDPWVPLNSR